MQRITYTVKNQLGIHARIATVVSETASQFHSDIRIVRHGKTADGKNVMQLMMMGIKCGETIECFADGKDETDAMINMLQCFEINL